ncbi:putative Ig domain-containing protein [Stieleria sp. ICT_E10.1]|uniref:putative Ig domain-containing protein n=1 Tax=Stieleria sedimenti TaxID=2976331 RepID=UPI0021807A5F|nr:putative Ig domain-containing protein [Stieleria sedimenti]MCS7469110.1 putative Ig domain-containing protein [Stieleria sedimenti]
MQSLEPRIVLDADPVNVFAHLYGEIGESSSRSEIPFQINSDNFLSARGTQALGFKVDAVGSGGLDPAAASIRDSGGTYHALNFANNDLSASVSSLVVAELMPGDYTLEVAAQNGTSGAFDVSVFLAGDLNGDGAVQISDRYDLIRLLRSTSYKIEADVNLDGLLTSFDTAHLLRNYGVSTSIEPLTLTADLDPVAQQSLPDGTPVTAVGAQSVSGLTNPGANIHVDFDSDPAIDVNLSVDAAGGFATPVTLTEGINQISVYASDSFGQSASVVLDVVLDTTAPALSLSLAADSDSDPVGDLQTTFESATVEGMTEPGQTVQLYRNGDLATAVDSTTADPDGKYRFSGQTLQLGSNLFTAIAVDLVGNSNQTNLEVTRVSADNTPPLIGLSLIDDTGVSSTDHITRNGQVAGQISDESGLVSIQAAIDRVAPGSLLDVASHLEADGSILFDSTLLSTLNAGPIPDGEFSVRVVAVDEHGNESRQSIAITLDSNAPNLDIASPIDGTITNTSVTVSGQATDDGSEIVSLEGKLDDGDLLSIGFDAAGVFNFNSALVGGATDDGPHTYALRATDLAGNVSGFQSVNFTLDTVSPVVAITAPADGLLTASNVSVTGQALDVGVGLQSARARFDHGEFFAITLDDAGNFSFPTMFAVDGSNDGPHTVEVQVTDRAGNVSELVSVSMTLDTAAPDAILSLAAASDTGVIGDGVTHLDVVTVEGQTEPGVTVVLLADGRATQADTNGRFSFAAVPLGLGGNRVEVRLTDSVENSAVVGEDFVRTVEVTELVERTDFTVSKEFPITVPDQPSYVQLTYSDLHFDQADEFINDAFEIALVDDQGNSLVHAIAGSADAAFNWTEGESPALGVNTLHEGETVKIDLTHIAAGTTATLVARLVNNDDDTTTSVAVSSDGIFSRSLGTPVGTTVFEKTAAIVSSATVAGQAASVTPTTLIGPAQLFTGSFDVIGDAANGGIESNDSAQPVEISGSPVTVTEVVGSAVTSNRLDYSGTDFWFATRSSDWGTFLISSDYEVTGTFEMLPWQAGSVSVPGYTETFSVSPGNPTKIVATQSGHARITTSGDVSVVALDAIFGKATAVIPTEALGTDYMILSWPDEDNCPCRSYSRFEINAIADDTSVTITTRETLADTSGHTAFNASLRHDVPNRTLPAGVPVTMTFNKGDDLSATVNYDVNSTIVTLDDLTGTTIQSDKPIFVTAGNSGELIEQMPPVNTWGSHYFTQPIPAFDAPYTIRVLAAEDETDVFIDRQKVATLDSGELHQQELSDTVEITSTNPVLVGQLTHVPPNEPFSGAVSTLVLTPVEQYVDTHRIVMPTHEWNSIPIQNLGIVAPSAAVGTLTIDGEPVPAGIFEPIGDSGFVSVPLEVESGDHFVTAAVPFSAAVYFRGTFDSEVQPSAFFYGSGGGLAPIASVDSVLLSTDATLNSVGREAVLRSVVLDEIQNPLPGVRVDLVIEGRTEAVGHAYTDENGIATFTYIGALPGLDQVRASVGQVNDSIELQWAFLAPPTITIVSPESGGTVTAGDSILVTGTAFSHADGGPITHVTVNDGPVDALDPSGNFFAGVTIEPGQNTFTFTAYDAFGQSDTETLLVTGVSSGQPDPIFDVVSDVSGSLIGRYGKTTYNARTKLLYVDLAIENDGDYPVDVPLIVGITNLSDPSVRVRGFDGRTADGVPFFDLSSHVADGMLEPGESSAGRTISFYDPNQSTFTYDLVVLGKPNEAPEILTTPVVKASIGRPYRYDVDAVDPERNTLQYSLLSGPSTAAIDASTGVVTWTPTGADLATHVMTVGVEDGRGGSTRQRFLLSVDNTPPNRPPQIDSIPLVDSSVGQTYRYQVEASDPDNDSVTFSVQTLPAPDSRDIMGSIPILNSGFEAQVLGDGGFRNGTLTDWSVVGAGGPFNPRSGDFTGGLASEGNNVAFHAGGSFSQVLAASLQANTRYTLQVDIGHRSGFGIPGYAVQLWAGGNLLVEDDSVMPADATFETLTVDYLAESDDPYLGLPLEIRLVSDGSQSIFDNVRLTTSLSIPTGMEIDPDSGLIEWIPPIEQFGPVGVSVIADDGNGGVTVQDFTLNVRSKPENFAPVILSIPVDEIATGRAYSYNVDATDPEGDDVVYLLEQAPAEMMIDPSSGLITWDASSLTPGDHSVVVHARDEFGSFDQQAYTLSMIDGGSISGVKFHDLDGDGLRDLSTNHEPGLIGWTIYLDDNDNGVLDDQEPVTTTDAVGQYQFYGLPPGQYVVREEQRTGWQQTAPSGDVHRVEIATSDPVEGVDFGNLHVPIDANLPPQFTSTPVESVSLGDGWHYQATAADPTNDPLTYRLSVHPTGMVISSSTGLVRWTPDAQQVGSHDAILRVSDGRGGVDLQKFQLNVTDNTPPVITSSAPLQAVAGLPYRYAVAAQDADEDTIAYQLQSTIPGMTINLGTGVLDWSAPTLGTHEVTLTAADGRGGIATQSYTLDVVADAPNVPPQIRSTPREIAVIGQNYRYRVAAEDANGDPLDYVLETAPAGMSLSANGLVQWVSARTQFGLHDVVLRVDDGRGGVARQEFVINVQTDLVNDPPEIISNPRQLLTLGEDYVYDPRGFDPDGDGLVWSLPTAPRGMSIDTESGSIRWTPDDDQLGFFPVTVVVDDGQGGTGKQSYSIRVQSNNIPPVITSTPPTIGYVGHPLTYHVEADDPDGWVLSVFEYKVNGPDGMQISNRGVLQWTPTADQVGRQNFVVVEVSDGTSSSFQPFIVEVLNAAPNAWPVMTSTPPPLATIDQPYTYELTAFDADGDATAFELIDGPTGMQLVGGDQLQWTPTDDLVGSHWVTVGVSDSKGGVGQQRFMIEAARNEPPEITSTAVTTVSAGARYRYDVQMDEPDGDPVGFRLVSAPEGMTVDSLGRIQWNPTSAQIGSHPIELVVADGRGGEDREAYTLDVTADSNAPTVLITLSDNPVNLGGQVDVIVTAVDDVGVDTISVTAGGLPIVLDSTGKATLPTSDAGSLDLVATATDAAGNIGQATDTLLVLDPADVDAPVVSIDSPDYGELVTGPIDVVGTVADDSLLGWTLSYAPFVGGSFIEIASGDQPVAGGVLGQFDPTLLSNDSYVLQLVAEDVGGKSSVEQILVEVTGDLKVGNFTLSFTDLSIPVSGIPIVLARTYDSLNAQNSDDFGFGWRMEFRDTDLRSSVAKTGAEEDLIYNPYHDGARVYVTVPGGRREGFTFRLTPAPGIGAALLGIFRGQFVPDPGVESSLTFGNYQLRAGTFGEAIDYTSGLPFNPASPLFHGGFTLTSKEGIQYEIAGDSGDLSSVKDRNGNTLTFTDDGVFSSTGQEITFERNAAGQISAVIDPAGERVEYQYDTAGDLVAVTDRENNTTTFKYEQPTRPHYLTEIVDPLGRTGIRSEYDDLGRLVKMIDADDQSIELIHDPANFIDTVKNQLGHETTYEYDIRGNVVTEIDGEGGITRYTYDDPNDPTLETSMTKLLADGTELTTTMQYDSDGNLIIEIDPLGRQTLTTFDSFGNVLTTTDPLGNTTINAYDASGNLLSITDPVGQVTSFTYDVTGNPLTMSLPGGNTQSFTYDGTGNVLTQTDALGHITTHTYDALGNQLTETRTQTTPTGTRTIVTASEYDSESRVRFQRLYEDGVLMWQTETQYDAGGNRIAEIDALGRVTQSVYDDRGLLVEMVYPDGTLGNDSDNPRTRTEYDAAGQTIAEINELGRRTEFVYDKAGREIAMIYPDDTIGDLTDNPRTSTEYDAAGRTIATVDARGNRTEFVLDAAGQQLEVIFPDRTPGDATDNPRTLTQYDIAGRSVSQTDPLGNVTRFEYDDAGRPLETIFVDGSSTKSVFDDAGRLASRIDQAGLGTDYEYDAAGRLTAVVLPEVDDPISGSRVRPRTEYEYDELGNLVVQRDARGRETLFEYDGQGRRTATVLPLGQRSSTTYNAVGNVISTTDFNGDTIGFEYDARDRLTLKDLPGAFPDVAYSYTMTNQLATVTDGRGTTTYSYDAQDRLASRTDPDGAAIGYTYDLSSNRTSVTTRVGLNPPRVTGYAFDAQNRMATVTDPEGLVTTYHYDAASRLVQTEFPNNTIENRTYDDLHRLTLVDTRNATTDEVLASFAYELDEVGNRTAMIEHDGRRVEYEYDELYRLTGETIFDAGSATTSRNVDYAYDIVGNRMERDDSAEGATTYTYDDNDRLLTETLAGDETRYSYDDNGNTLSKTSPTDTVFYSWDPDNRLIAADTDGDGTDDVTYQYDHEGMRVSRTTSGEETRFLLDKNRPYAQVLEEYAPGGVIKVSYVHGHDLISQNRQEETGKSFYHVDGLGSTRALSDALGVITDRYIYDAYGQTIGQAGETVNVYLFAGEQRDETIGLDYLRDRYMVCSLGRFVARDRYEGTIVRPASLSDYQYVENDPINYVDPTGKWPARYLAYVAILASLAYYGLKNLDGENRGSAGGNSESPTKSSGGSQEEIGDTVRGLDALEKGKNFDSALQACEAAFDYNSSNYKSCISSQLRQRDKQINKVIGKSGVVRRRLGQ